MITNSGVTRVGYLAIVAGVICMLAMLVPSQALAAEECNDGTNSLTLPEDPVPSSNPYSNQCEAVMQGGKLYFTWCVQCHGVEADGRSPRWGGYAKDLRRFWAGYSQFIAITIAGRPKLKMPPWAGVLNPEQISYIGAYLETLALDGANWKDH